MCMDAALAGFSCYVTLAVRHPVTAVRVGPPAR